MAFNIKIVEKKKKNHKHIYLFLAKFEVYGKIHGQN
jgi:hypothetical protein